MLKLNKRIEILEAEQLREEVIDDAQLEADVKMVCEYFEANDCRLDLEPRKDFTPFQREMLAARIKFEANY